MSKVWGTMLILSIVISMATGNVSVVISSIMESSENAIENVITLAGMMCFWNGIFNIFENTSILEKLSSKFKYIIYLLFQKNELSQKAIDYMSLNITSNIIGIGNASTLNGIKAIEELQNNNNNNKDLPSNNMTTFVLLNTASLQLIPTNIIALRAMYGSSNPTEIVVPIWIVTLCSLTVGISAIKILNKRI